MTQWPRKGVSLHKKWDPQLAEGGKVFFEDIDVNHIISVVREEEGSVIEKDDRGLMLPSAKTQRNTQGLNRAMRLAGIT
ncbi:MAG TPA: hypothetical protein VEI50_08050 [Nitrospiraceae bacterium]|nr:hypothetical protein [Nitrospiraceae bacterium]